MNSEDNLEKELCCEKAAVSRCEVETAEGERRVMNGPGCLLGLDGATSCTKVLHK